MSGKKMVCDCGCGRREWHNKLVEVVVEEAIDESLRQTHTSQRFWVRRECKESFEEELQMKVLLKQLADAWQRKLPLSLWRWVNPFHPLVLFINWIRRINASRKVMRLVHAINERIYGFDYAKKRALNSAVLMGAPRWMQGFLARRFFKGLEKAHQEALAAQALRNAETDAPA